MRNRKLQSWSEDVKKDAQGILELYKAMDEALNLRLGSKKTILLLYSRFDRNTSKGFERNCVRNGR